jgi:hypothetical protein
MKKLRGMRVEEDLQAVVMLRTGWRFEIWPGIWINRLWRINTYLDIAICAVYLKQPFRWLRRSVML